MNKKNSVGFYKITSLLIYLIVGIVVVVRGAVFSPDSFTFVNMAFNHSPVYCLFLKIFTSIFGNNFEFPVIIVQYFIIVLGVLFLLKYLKNFFNLNHISTLFLQLIMLAPCVYLHFLGSAILSEALTYPLFLILFRYVLKMFVEEDVKYVYISSLILTVLILIRGQFIALIPVIFLITFYLINKNKEYLKNFKVLIVIITIPIITTFLEKTYNKVFYGYFVNNSMNYVHLITSPFYISNENDIHLFSEEDEKAYFRLIYNSLNESELLRNQISSNKEDDYLFYHQNFSNICNKRIYKLGLEYFESKGLNFFEQNIELNKLCSKMVFPLVKQNFEVWIALFFKNLQNSFASTKQILLFLMLLAYSLYYINRKTTSIFKFIILGTLFMFANNSLVAVAIHSIKRYLFYFDWLIFAIIIIFINEILKHKFNNEC